MGRIKSKDAIKRIEVEDSDKRGRTDSKDVNKWCSTSGLGEVFSSSRCEVDFEQMRYLGEGGYGSVVLCQNKLDKGCYALKMIPRELEEEKILREVETLSVMRHQHVVRYFNSWWDHGFAKPMKDSGSDSRAIREEKPSEEKPILLVIQMEYVSRTLRDILDGPSFKTSFNKNLAAEFFIQMTKGLAHIHKMGIVHRDFNPQNIFVNEENVIKIGDFGLAKFLKAEQHEGVSRDDTGSIGNELYMAPESKEPHPKVNEKADIYSLGIVLFELYHPFSTGMGRMVAIKQLTEKNELPEDWRAEFPEQARLVERLMALKPSDRPSANEIIRNAFPPQNARTTHYSPMDSSNRYYVSSVTQEVFRQYFGTLLEIFPIHQLDNCSDRETKAVRLLSHEGDTIELCYELRSHFIKWVVANQISFRRSYTISFVYRKASGSSPLKRYLQGDFDMIGGDPLSSEAKGIQVTRDVLLKFFHSKFLDIHLNHGNLLEALWKWIGVEPHCRLKLQKDLLSMSKLRPESAERVTKWAVIKNRLEDLNLPETVVNRLEDVCLRFCAPADQALPRLRRALPEDESTWKALDELSKLCELLRGWKIENHVYIDALMPPIESYHSDVFFQVCLTLEDREESSTVGLPTYGVLLAIGGRYDHLVSQTWGQKHRSSPPVAFGISIAMETIINHSSSWVCENVAGVDED